jgi:hemoglobin
MHRGNGPHQEMDRRGVACFERALVDAGLAIDDRL